MNEFSPNPLSKVYNGKKFRLQDDSVGYFWYVCALDYYDDFETSWILGSTQTQNPDNAMLFCQAKAEKIAKLLEEQVDEEGYTHGWDVVEVTEFSEKQKEQLGKKENEMNELEQKLEQAKKDKQIGLDAVDAVDAEIARLEAEIKESQKPKLRHGDYGLCKKRGKLCGFSYEDAGVGSQPQFFLVCLKKGDYEGLYPDVDEIVSINGNFADLEHNSEDLREFEVSGQYDTKDVKTLKVHAAESKKVWLHINTNSSYFTTDQAKEIHQKLGQLIATAERDIRKKEQ